MMKMIIKLNKPISGFSVKMRLTTPTSSEIAAAITIAICFGEMFFIVAMGEMWMVDGGWWMVDGG